MGFKEMFSGFGKRQTKEDEDKLLRKSEKLDNSKVDFSGVDKNSIDGENNEEKLFENGLIDRKKIEDRLGLFEYGVKKMWDDLLFYIFKKNEHGGIDTNSHKENIDWIQVENILTNFLDTSEIIKNTLAEILNEIESTNNELLNHNMFKNELNVEKIRERLKSFENEVENIWDLLGAIFNETDKTKENKIVSEVTQIVSLLDEARKIRATLVDISGVEPPKKEQINLKNDVATPGISPEDYKLLQQINGENSDELREKIKEGDLKDVVVDGGSEDFLKNNLK